jgi:gliding motility-associated-like protein
VRWPLVYIQLLLFSIVKSQVSLIPDTLRLCPGDTASLQITRQLGADAAVIWTTPYGIITNTRRVKAGAAGRYRVRVTGGTLGTVADSCTVSLLQKPRQLLRDTFFCRGRTVILDAGNPGLRYTWSTGEVTQRIRVGLPGIYSVRVSNGACSVSDSARVTAAMSPGTPVTQEFTFCVSDDNRLIGVRQSPGTEILWNTGATTASISPQKEGAYWARIKYPRCGEETDTLRVKLKLCECEMLIPNSFTPNEDGRNDYFFPVSQCEYSYFLLAITDRWGNPVFSTNSQSGRWDGRFKGNLCPEDIYIYRIETVERAGERKQVRTGHISLFR